MELITRPIKTILLIDDDVDDCVVFRTALKDISSSIVLSCLNESEAILQAITNLVPDLIFLDINMPRLDGFNCLKQLQEHGHYARIPIVMYSSSSNPKEINAAYGYGAALFFSKPTNYSNLVDCLQSILLMNWNQPEQIRAQYFREGQYQPFNLKRHV